MTGRAERLRLRRGLAVAERGAGLLDRRLRVLRDELRRRSAAERDARRMWEERARQADTWLLRGLLLSGERALEAAAAAGPARVEVEWATSMGVRHPARVRYTAADPAPVSANSALVYAQAAYREAVRAAAEYAAAAAAVRLIGAEARATRQRVRALRRHWIPRLSAALAAAELALEQSEHEDAVRRRWAAGGL